VTIVSRVLAIAGLLIVGWVVLTEGGAVRHGHPAYAVLLAVTGLGSVLILWRNWDGGPSRGPLRLIAAVVLRVLMVGWLLLVWWLRPFSAEEPALAAMDSDRQVTITETPTRIAMVPTAARTGAHALVFQPGAKVEARAYAAVLRPLAEAGHTVIIVKAPLGMAFLAPRSLDQVRAAHPEITGWIVGGHSLGGVVASAQANIAKPAVDGLLLYASYPANDITDLDADVLSISGTKDGLSTPADIRASRSKLPSDARFVAIAGAVHSQFGDYGTQPGDGTPTISHDQARSDISEASLEFAARLGAGD
jgi:predicted alpha/beta-hydrolase family hydrolase